MSATYSAGCGKNETVRCHRKGRPSPRAWIFRRAYSSLWACILFSSLSDVPFVCVAVEDFQGSDDLSGWRFGCSPSCICAHLPND